MRPVKTVRLTDENGRVYRAGLAPSRAAREMFVKRDHLVFMLDQHGTCVVENPTYLKAVWETRP